MEIFWFFLFDLSDAGHTANPTSTPWNCSNSSKYGVSLPQITYDGLKTPAKLHYISKISILGLFGILFWHFWEGGQLYPPREFRGSGEKICYNSRPKPSEIYFFGCYSSKLLWNWPPKILGPHKYNSGCDSVMKISGGNYTPPVGHSCRGKKNQKKPPKMCTLKWAYMELF